VLRGYLLEEALAWLLRNTGYQLLERFPSAGCAAWCVPGRAPDRRLGVPAQAVVSSCPAT
jgi:hypothetical protein